MRFTGLKTLFIAIAALLSVAATSCGSEHSEPRRSVYYWNTVFNIDSMKLDFIARHGISKMYVRYFDVVPGKAGGEARPNATIRFDSIPPLRNIEIVPTVFILPTALAGDPGTLARKILRRVKQMNETHGLGPVRELQIDCDWTTSTRQPFFRFMELLKKDANAEGIALSSTIRLHQLAAPPPPADRGVLMVYNTGDLRDFDKRYPILDPEDVLPYLKHLDGFDLPLASAYPIYRWDIVFRDKKFIDIQHYPGEMPVLPSDTIVARETPPEHILGCRREIEKRRPDCASEIILFDLNNFNIQRYDSETFEKFYN